jgi:nitroreductase
MTLLDLSADDVLTTTRAVRKRLDYSRPVDDDVIRDCVATAMQAPSGSNVMTMQFVVVKDEAKKQAIGRIYRECFDVYRTLPIYAGAVTKESSAEQAQQQRVTDSANHLAEHMGEAPVLVIGCTFGRADNLPAVSAVAMMGNILPGMWSLMLAARARGLGTAWTTLSLMREREVAEIVGIPFDSVQQSCLTPLAYTTGTDFKRAMRPDPDTIIHWDTW